VILHIFHKVTECKLVCYQQNERCRGRNKLTQQPTEKTLTLLLVKVWQGKLNISVNV